MISRSTIFTVLFISLISMASLSGCKKSVAGTYELDKAAVKVAAEAEMKKKQSDPNDPMAAMGATMMLGMIDTMNFSLTLTDDGAATMHTSAMGQSTTATGTYSVSGSTITISMAEQGQAPQSVKGTIQGDSITLKPPQGEETPFDLVLKKKKA